MKKRIKLAVINENCCGIDVGSKSHHVATGLDISDIKEYGVFTDDHKSLVKDLKEKGVKHVAMESTGSYWQTLFESLQEAGFDVALIDGKQTKNYKKKTDYQDARAIYQLHSLGFLSSCFLPDNFTLSIRRLYRYRCGIIEEQNRLTNRIQKIMRLMNFRIDNILSDVMGKSGQAIIKAIISGERKADQLVKYIDRRVKTPKAELVKGCEGQWDETQVFLLTDAYETFLENQKRIIKIDLEIKKILDYHLKDRPMLKGTKKQLGKNQINIGLQNISRTYYNVDLFAIESVSYNLVMTLISEVGLGINKFSSSKEFCSWLRLAPNNKISGGKIISSRTPKGKNPLALALRNSANTISKSKNGHLKSFFNRIAYKKGRGAAITATARKLATIIWIMVTKQEEYNPQNETIINQKIKQNIMRNMLIKLKRNQIDYEELISYVR